MVDAVKVVNRALRQVAKPLVRSPLTPTRVARLMLSGSLHEAVDGRVVLITGASSGIGEAAAMRIGAAGGHVLLLARTVEKLEQIQAAIVAAGGKADCYRCDLTDFDDIDRVSSEILANHGRVDVLVNNAGRSIRRSVALSYDRMHDFERTMALNYFGAVQLILKLLPGMRERGDGHIVNISSGGVQAHAPRFSAYIASKSALDAFSSCIAPEIHHDGVKITTIYMPLVRTPMIATTKDLYRGMPSLSAEEAAEMIAEAIATRPRRLAATGPSLIALAYQVSPGGMDAVLNASYHLTRDKRRKALP